MFQLPVNCSVSQYGRLSCVCRVGRTVCSSAAKQMLFCIRALQQQQQVWLVVGGGACRAWWVELRAVAALAHVLNPCELEHQPVHHLPRLTPSHSNLLDCLQWSGSVAVRGMTATAAIEAGQASGRHRRVYQSELRFVVAFVDVGVPCGLEHQPIQHHPHFQLLHPKAKHCTQDLLLCSLSSSGDANAGVSWGLGGGGVLCAVRMCGVDDHTPMHVWAHTSC